jgi:hypothetical protein
MERGGGGFVFVCTQPFVEGDGETGWGDARLEPPPLIPNDPDRPPRLLQSKRDAAAHPTHEKGGRKNKQCGDTSRPINPTLSSHGEPRTNAEPPVLC